MLYKVKDWANVVINVIALDPGVTTGWAEGLIDESGLMRVRCDQHQFTHLGLWDWLTMRKMNYLIYETFEFRKGQLGVNYYPIEMIGVIKLFAEQCKFDLVTPRLVDQTPTWGKGYFTDEELKRVEVYKKGKPHGRDAMRHLLQWYTFGSGYAFNKKGVALWTS